MQRRVHTQDRGVLEEEDRSVLGSVWSKGAFSKTRDKPNQLLTINTVSEISKAWVNTKISCLLPLCFLMSWKIK